MRNWQFPIELDAQGKIVVLEDLEALKLKVNERLALFKSTWILDITRGVPYLQDIMKKPVDPGLVASILNNEILKESEVTSLSEVETTFDADTRVFTYTATVNTIYGTTTAEVNL